MKVLISKQNFAIKVQGMQEQQKNIYATNLHVCNAQPFCNMLLWLPTNKLQIYTLLLYLRYYATSKPITSCFSIQSYLKSMLHSFSSNIGSFNSDSIGKVNECCTKVFKLVISSSTVSCVTFLATVFENKYIFIDILRFFFYSDNEGMSARSVSVC